MNFKFINLFNIIKKQKIKLFIYNLIFTIIIYTIKFIK